MNNTNTITVGDVLNKARKDKGITEKALADATGIVEATVKNILSNRTKYPRRDTLEPIAEALDVPMEELIKIMNDGQKNANGYNCHQCVTAEYYERIIEDIRSSNDNMEQHYEKRLADKREVIAELEKHIDTIKLDKKFFRLGFFIVLTVFLAALIGLTVAELMHPEHGWLRY